MARLVPFCFRLPFGCLQNSRSGNRVGLFEGETVEYPAAKPGSLPLKCTVDMGLLIGKIGKLMLIASVLDS